MNFKVTFWFVDPWDASCDRFEDFSCTAASEEDAVRQFREEHGDDHVVQCVTRV